jgi:hypothetical protein
LYSARPSVAAASAEQPSFQIRIFEEWHDTIDINPIIDELTPKLTQGQWKLDTFSA